MAGSLLGAVVGIGFEWSAAAHEREPGWVCSAVVMVLCALSGVVFVMVGWMEVDESGWDGGSGMVGWRVDGRRAGKTKRPPGSMNPAASEEVE